MAEVFEEEQHRRNREIHEARLDLQRALEKFNKLRSDEKLAPITLNVPGEEGSQLF